MAYFGVKGGYMRHIIWFLGVWLSVTALQARIGNAGCAFLSRGGGARPVALGGAYSALPGGPEAVFWNPAGLTGLKSFGAIVCGDRFFSLINQTDLAVAMPIMDGTIGIGLIATSSGAIEETTPEFPDGTGTYFSVVEYALGVSYARKMTDRFSVGATVKFVSSSMWKVHASGWAIDLGGQYDVGISGLKFGFFLQNFAPEFRYSGDGLHVTVEEEGTGIEYPGSLLSGEFPLPLNFQAGFAIDLLKTPKTILTADLVHPIDQPAVYGAGVEIEPVKGFTMRVGYTKKNNRNLCAGLGFHVGKIAIHYSYENHDYLPGVHRLEIDF